ncbi:hypothetical protein EVAR_45652_1 [Eumeta japonica]|uniref:Uncharacterized protein n=1 Tax=Eumeta variegata TaxID=151549 RepID=A0A4C1Y7G7_EUMVA|nr:hypothetical protein EVAR_45652_1 [Eumeta japonica]
MVRELLNSPLESVATKVLAYKVFMRPLLVYEWYDEKRARDMKSLEICALAHIFRTRDKNLLYSLYSDVDVNNYIRLNNLNWQRASRCKPSVLHRLLQQHSRFDEDLTVYFDNES